MATAEFYSQYNPHIHQQMPSLSLLTNTCNHYYPSRQDYSPLSSTGGEYGAVSPATTVSSTGSDGAYNGYSLYYNQYGGYAPPPPPPQSQSYRAAILPWQQTFTFDTMKYNGQATARRSGLNKCNCPNCLNDSGTQQRKGAGKRVHICHYPGCEKKYGKTSHLLAHIRSHTGERPYGCAWSFCGKRFTRSDECQRHYRTHTGDKRYQCKECPKKFIRSDHLKKHEKTHANPKKEKKNNDTTPSSTTSDKQQTSYSYSPINNQSVTKEANASSLMSFKSASDNDSSTKSPTTNLLPYDYNHLSLATNSIFDQPKKETVASSSVPFSHTNLVSNNQGKKSPTNVSPYDYNSLSLSTSPAADNQSASFSPINSVSHSKTKKSSPTLIPYEYSSSNPTYDQSNRLPAGSNLVPFNELSNNKQSDKSQSPFNYSSGTISDNQSNSIGKRFHSSNLVQFGYGSLPAGDNNHLVLKREISASNLVLDPSIENANILSHNNFIDSKTDLLTRHYFNLPYLT